MNEHNLKIIYNIREELAKVHFSIIELIKDIEKQNNHTSDNAEKYLLCEYKKMSEEMDNINLQLISFVNKIENEIYSEEDYISYIQLSNKILDIRKKLEIMLG